MPEESVHSKKPSLHSISKRLLNAGIDTKLYKKSPPESSSLFPKQAEVLADLDEEAIFKAFSDSS